MREPTVKVYPFFYQSLAVDLTPSDLQALQHIKEGLSISIALRTRLETLDLIEEGLDGWRLTDQGSYRLVTGQDWHPSHDMKSDQPPN